MADYTGITIGPIFDTLLLAHSPAAMWFASKMFSLLTENICRELSLYENTEIISPYFNDPTEDDGIGKYHDRVIIKAAEDIDIEKVISSAKEKTSEEIARALGSTNETKKAAEIKDFLNNYFQIHTARVPDGADGFNSISHALDCLEQMPSPNVSETNNNVFKNIFKGRTFRNENVKAYLIQKYQGSSWLLKSKNALRDISDIANNGNSEDTLKRSNYYAVVEADGDGVGTYLCQQDDKSINDFSEKCFAYAEKAVQLIKDFGGMPVYAGGDDLLFISPVYNSEKEQTVFSLCDSIQRAFDETVNNDALSLSFGISVRYERFPLYEALNSSITALREAKLHGGRATVTDFRKASGQAIKIFVPHKAFADFTSLLDIYKEDKSENAVKKMHSLIYTLSKHKNLLNLAHDRLTTENIIDNAFDNADQKVNKAFTDTAKKAVSSFIEKKDTSGIKLLSENDADDTLKTVTSILRISKFFTEKEGERNE